MRYGSVCSGIEAATQAWHPLGWTPAFFSEIEKFPSQVLAHHYGSNMPGESPASNGVPNYGDMTNFEEWPDHAIDILVGGTPCQDYSIAGLRAGMDGVRGSLTLTYAAIARRYRPRWVVWENVPGVFSSNGGRDFASFLGLMSGRRIEVPRNGWRTAGVIPGYERAYGIAWRVLDAQYVRVDGYERAVPQRRRRVFVVGHLGDWRRAAAVLFERESMSGNSAPRREAGQGTAADVAPSLVSSGRGVERAGDTRGQDPVVAEFVSSTGSVPHCLNAGGMGRQGYETETMIAQPYTLAIRGRGESHDLEYRQDGTANALLTPNGGRAGIGVGAVCAPIAFAQNTPDEVRVVNGDGLIAGCLGEEAGMKQQTYLAFKGKGETSASQTKSDTFTPLHRMRGEVGEEAFAKWGLGILDSLQSSEILQSEVHGRELRQTSQARSKMVGCTSRSKVDGSDGALREMWISGRERRSPQGSELSEQCTGELGAYLSQLSQSGAFEKKILFDLRQTSQGIGILREALSALQELWGSNDEQGQQALYSWDVRRLTPKECERLMGFPDGYTNIPVGKKMAADGPRYKALGNSMAINCMRWIGQRIKTVESIK